jgi:ATP-dependent DNA helicase DinG
LSPPGSDFIDQQGRSSFGEYSIPAAVIALKQGVGRLIRSASDRGVLSILDPRLVTKSYGRDFMRSLPPCRVTRKIGDVERLSSVPEQRTPGDYPPVITQMIT